MAEPRPFHVVLLGQLHRAVVSRLEPEGADALSLDPSLMEAAGFLPHEKVEVVSATSGVRLALGVREAPAGSSQVGVHGAATQLLQLDEVLTISSWGWLRGKPARRHEPKCVALGPLNSLVKTPKG